MSSFTIKIFVDNLMKEDYCKIICFIIRYNLKDELIFCDECKKSHDFKSQYVLKNFTSCSCNYNFLITVKKLCCDNYSNRINITTHINSDHNFFFHKHEKKTYYFKDDLGDDYFREPITF